jgi:hypothetical protein
MTHSQKLRKSLTLMPSPKSVKFKFSALLLIYSFLSLSTAIAETKKTREIFQLDISEKKRKKVFPYDIKESQEKRLDKKTRTRDLPRHIGNIRLGMTENEFRKLYPERYETKTKAEHDQNIMGFGATLLPYRSEQIYPEGKLVILGHRPGKVKTAKGLKIASNFRVEFWNNYLFSISVNYPEFLKSDLVAKYGKSNSTRKFRVHESDSQCTKGNGVVGHKKQADDECDTWQNRNTYVQWCAFFRGFRPTPFVQQPPPCSGSVGHREINYFIKDNPKDEIVRAAHRAKIQSEGNTRKQRAKNSKDF